MDIYELVELLFGGFGKGGVNTNPCVVNQKLK